MNPMDAGRPGIDLIPNELLRATMDPVSNLDRLRLTYAYPRAGMAYEGWDRPSELQRMRTMNPREYVQLRNKRVFGMPVMDMMWVQGPQGWRNVMQDRGARLMSELQGIEWAASEKEDDAIEEARAAAEELPPSPQRDVILQATAGFNEGRVFSAHDDAHRRLAVVLAAGQGLLPPPLLEQVREAAQAALDAHVRIGDYEETLKGLSAMSTSFPRDRFTRTGLADLGAHTPTGLGLTRGDA